MAAQVTGASLGGGGMEGSGMSWVNEDRADTAPCTDSSGPQSFGRAFTNHPRVRESGTRLSGVTVLSLLLTRSLSIAGSTRR